MREALRSPTILRTEVLAGLYPDLPQGRPGVEQIQQQVAIAWGLSQEELISTNRSAAVSLARQVAMHLARELTDHTLPAIGRAFGNRNHTTVMHACKRTAERIAKDPEAFATVERLTRELQGGDGDRPA